MRDRLFAAIVKNGCEEYGGNAMCDGNCFDRCEDCITAVNVGKLVDALIAEGVIVPPCKVGDTVYYIHEGVDRVYEGELTSFVYVSNTNSFGIHYDGGYGIFGRYVFLTREEAEKALARMKGEGNAE